MDPTKDQYGPLPPDVTVPDQSPPPDLGALPFSGAELWVLVAVALVLVALGFFMYWAER